MYVCVYICIYIYVYIGAIVGKNLAFEGFRGLGIPRWGSTCKPFGGPNDRKYTWAHLWRRYLKFRKDSFTTTGDVASCAMSRKSL